MIKAKLTKRTIAIDWFLIIPIIYLIGMGLVILQSIDQSIATSEFVMSTQYIALGLGIIILVIFARTDQSFWKRAAFWVYSLAVFLLILTLFTGDEIQGSQRWIELAGFQLQPSEMAKFGLLTLLALLFAKRKKEVNKPWNIGISILYAVIPTILILMQPDLGTAIVYLVIWFALVSVSYIRKSTLLLLTIVALLTIPIMLPLMAEYQRNRIDAFLNPASDPSGKSYNAIQASIAVGSGGVFGKGLDAGSQSQLNFLPSQHTDFIFAVISEKLGLIGAMSILIAFVVLVSRLFIIAWSSQFQFGGYVALGTAIIISIQAAVNIGMNLGIFPIAGVPLPFVSFGGSHLITELALVGLVLGTNRSQHKL